jgi:iron complex transport system substrate-binding protein
LLAASACQPAETRPAARSETPRIISLSPAATDTLVALDAASFLVGIGRYGDPPTGRQLPRVGGLHDPNLEVIRALRPTLIVTTESKHNGPLERLGTPVVQLAESDLASVLANVALLGAKIGRDAQAAALVERLTEGCSAAPPAASAPTTLLVFSREGEPVQRAWVAGPTGWLGELMHAAGLRNALSDGAPFVELGAEAIVALAPALIIELHADPKTAPSGAATRAAWAGLRPVPAVRDGRIVSLAGAGLLRPGPSMIEAVRRLRQLR